MQPTAQEKATAKRDAKGRFLKGSSGNPSGHNAGTSYLRELEEALKLAESKFGKPFLYHFVERAYRNDRVATALAKKILPDKHDVTGAFEGGGTQIIIVRSGEKKGDKAHKREGLPTESVPG